MAQSIFRDNISGDSRVFFDKSCWNSQSPTKLPWRHLTDKLNSNLNHGTRTSNGYLLLLRCLTWWDISYIFHFPQIVYMIFLGLFGYMITTRYSGNHFIIGWIIFGIVLGYLVDEIRQVRSHSISLLIMASTHYAFFIIQFFCTIMLKPKR